MRALKYIAIILILIASSLFSKENTLYLVYDKYPKKIYANQVFEIKLKLLTNNFDFDHLKTSFEKNAHIKILNKEEEWEKEDNNTFLNTYYMSISDRSLHLPKIQIDAIKYENKKKYNNNIFDNFISIIADDTNDTNNTSNIQKIETIKASTFLRKKKISIYPIKWSENYSKLIATDFKIIDYEVEKYDNKENIIAIEMGARYANLYDFKINNKDITKQKIKILEDTLPYSKAIYYATINKNLKTFKFNYFNLDKVTFKYESLPIVLEQETISTQTDINPRKNNFKYLKTIFLAICILIFTALFIFKEKKIYLIIISIFAIILGITLIPFDKTLLPKGTKVKILPIEKSTVFFILDRDIKAEILKYKNGFVKVLFKKKVGWVNEKIINKQD